MCEGDVAGTGKEIVKMGEDERKEGKMMGSRNPNPYLGFNHSRP